MVRELYQRLREYFNNLPEPTEEERQFIRELNAGYFPITSVHRDDLEGQGFDVEKIRHSFPTRRSSDHRKSVV